MTFYEGINISFLYHTENADLDEVVNAFEIPRTALEC